MFPPIHHFNLKRAGLGFDWSGADSLSLFQENQSRPDQKKLLDLGSWHEHSIHYHYNSLGFRDREFDLDPCGLALGCSFTEGIGVDQSDAWPHRLSNLAGMRFWNLGVGGASMDTVYRILHHVLKTVIPRCVVICAPPAVRFEYGSPDGTYHVIYAHSLGDRIEHQFFKSWFVQYENWHMHHVKNIAACRYLCHEHKVPNFVFCGRQDFPRDDRGRDLSHPGPKSHAKFADFVWQQIQNKY